MRKKFKNKYCVDTIRLKHWDYRKNGCYFVTICTKNRISYFGNVIDGKVYLSKLGRIAYNYWQQIPDHFPFVKLGEFIVMPNHIHGIIIINWNYDYNINVEINKKQFMSIISPNSGSLSTIIRSYKSAVTKNAHKTDPNFSWQSRFYEHIIRNKKSFEKISEYIINNPLKWRNDKYYA